MPVCSTLPLTSMKTLLGAVDHDVGDVVAGQQRLQRAVAENVVADVLEQFLLLGDRHREVLDRDDVVDDVADFLARAVGVELGQLRQVDRVDQRREDLALGVVVGLAALALARLRLRRDRRRLDRAARAAAGGAAAAAARRRGRGAASAPARPRRGALRRGRRTEFGRRPRCRRHCLFYQT